MHRIATMAAWALAASTLSACSLLLPSPTPPTSGPTDGGPVHVDAAALARDGSAVRLDFTGAAEFDPADACTRAYVGEAGAVGEELHVTVIALRHPLAGQGNVICDLVGQPRSLLLELDPPYLGVVVRDASLQLIRLKAPF